MSEYRVFTDLVLILGTVKQHFGNGNRCCETRLLPCSVKVLQFALWVWGRGVRGVGCFLKDSKSLGVDFKDRYKILVTSYIYMDHYSTTRTTKLYVSDRIRYVSRTQIGETWSRRPVVLIPKRCLFR